MAVFGLKKELLIEAGLILLIYHGFSYLEYELNFETSEEKMKVVN